MLSVIMLSVIMLSVVILSAVMLSVVMLSGVVPYRKHGRLSAINECLISNIFANLIIENTSQWSNVSHFTLFMTQKSRK